MRNIDNTVFIAEGARILRDVVIGEKSSVWFNAVLRGDNDQITIGKRSNIQDCCVIHCDKDEPVVIGDDVTVGHSAIIHSCKIGDNTLIGMGAIVMNGAEIGSNCIIGAGALVTQRTKIPDGSLVIGSPAKVKRQLTDEEIKGNMESSEEYQELARIFMNDR